MLWSTRKKIIKRFIQLRFRIEANKYAMTEKKHLKNGHLGLHHCSSTTQHPVLLLPPTPQKNV